VFLLIRGALALALSLAVATPASAMTREQATSRALAALGASTASGPVIVFGLPKPLRAGSRVSQGSTRKHVLAVGRERALFFYQDEAPFQPYPHPGRVALVSARSGKVTLSRTLMRAPRVNGRLPAFLRSRAAYGSPRYRAFERSGSAAKAPADGDSAPAALREDDPFAPLDGENSPPTAFGQELTVKQSTPKRVTLTATDPDENHLSFQIIERPRRGKLTGQPPDLVYTPGSDYLGPDRFVFVARDDESESEPAQVALNVVPRGEPPTVTTSRGCTAYTEQERAVAIDGEMLVSDPDDWQLDRATVRIVESFQDGDELRFTDQNGIISSYDGDAGVLTLTGTASVEAYLSALRSVEYRNEVSANPTKTKYIQFTVNDAGLDSAPAIKRLCIYADNDPPTVDNGEGPVLYTENDGRVAVDGGFVVADPDSAYLSRATVAFAPHVAGTFIPAEDELAFTDQRGITGRYDDTNGVLELTGIASVADYQAAIRSVTYENTSEDPSEVTRRLQFQVTDSDGASSATVGRHAYITAVNDAPRVVASEGWTIWTGKPTRVDPDLWAVDVDDDLHAAVVRISDGFVHGDVLEYTDEFGIGGDYDREGGVLTLKGTAPAAVYEAALRSVAYHHADGTPTGSRTLEFVTYDGELESAAAAKVVEINDPPVLEANPKPLVYTQGDGWVALDDAITVSDPDSTYLVGATVAIERGFSDWEDELALFEEQKRISWEYDDSIGVLTLTGEATVAEYETALRSVMYENWSEPWAARVVTFQADDGAAYNNLSEPVHREIEITPRW